MEADVREGGGVLEATYKTLTPSAQDRRNNSRVGDNNTRLHRRTSWHVGNRGVLPCQVLFHKTLARSGLRHRSKAEKKRSSPPAPIHSSSTARVPGSSWRVSRSSCTRIWLLVDE